ncbi:MAG: cell division protein FtsZ [Bacteroidales bacterium]|nr:cell division protein FtsZ [Bacteroidales bacterium]
MSFEDINREPEVIVPATWTPENSMIKVVGVGGGGCNAVNYMYNQHIEGCSFIVANTDPQSLKISPVPIKVRMGDLGAGTDPIKGRNAAIEAEKEIAEKVLDCETKMLFITAGMGGGTGTGGAPVIAKMAHDRGILTVGVVTLPFKNERNGSLTKALDGIHELQKYVDSLLVIDNQKILEVHKELLITEAFPKADEVLATAVKSIIEIISRPGYINVDFKDVKNMMSNSGLALMGRGEGRGESRIADAVQNAMVSPLLLAFDPSTAKNVLVNVTVGNNSQTIQAGDLDIIDDELRKYLGNANRFKRGIVYDNTPEFGDTVCITVIATGITMKQLDELYPVEDTNLIRINPDFVYDRESCDEISAIQESEQIERRGANSNSNARSFFFSEKPLLCIEKGGDRSAVEGQAAYYRAYPKDEE